MTATLSSGSILSSYASAGSTDASTTLPEMTVQILHIKHMLSQGTAAGAASDRYKLIVSDGKHYMTGIYYF